MVQIQLKKHTIMIILYLRVRNDILHLYSKSFKLHIMQQLNQSTPVLCIPLRFLVDKIINQYLAETLLRVTTILLIKKCYSIGITTDEVGDGLPLVTCLTDDSNSLLFSSVDILEHLQIIMSWYLTYM